MIDFVNEMVQTLAGNGTKGSDYKGGRSGSTQARFRASKFKNRPMASNVLNIWETSQWRIACLLCS